MRIAEIIRNVSRTLLVPVPSVLSESSDITGAHARIPRNPLLTEKRSLPLAPPPGPPSPPLPSPTASMNSRGTRADRATFVVTFLEIYARARTHTRGCVISRNEAVLPIYRCSLYLRYNAAETEKCDDINIFPCFSRRSADNHDLRDGHRHTGG